MTGRRLVSWYDDSGSPQVSLQELWDGSAAESFEDDLIARMDYERELKKLVARLSPAEAELLSRILIGEKPRREDKDTLYRLRSKLAATKWAQKAL